MRQKAVVNAIVSTRLCTDPNESRKLYMDKHHSAPELFVMLKTKYQILACDTVQTNWKGWDQKMMNLLKSATSGDSKMFYNPINRLLFGQWKDNKVVLFISTLQLVGNRTIMQQSGSEKITCPKALQA